jgi:Ca-activated chloride channel family protein
MILFDVSESMLAEDMAPSRIEFAKKEVNRVLDLLPGSKVGLVAFAGSAALVSPITTDASALKMFTEFLNTETVSTQGTDFKKALEEADLAFERGGQGTDPATRVTRVILIISDGEDHEEGALEVAKKIADKGVRIFAVAVGTEKGGAIPQRDINGILRGYKKTKEGQQIISTVNGNALKEIAQKGKGSFYFASFEGTYLKNLAADIDKLDKAEFDSELVTQFEERYQGFLFVGFLFAFFAILIKSRKSGANQWRGRFEVQK